MAFPLIAMGAGAALSIYGNIKANQDQASAIRKNILWAAHQQSFMERANEREERLFRNQTNAIVGEQAVTAGASGLEMSGSVLDVMNSTINAAEDEINAMRDNASMQRMQNSLNIRQMQTESSRLSSTGWNLLQGATIGLNAFAGAAPYMRAGARSGASSSSTLSPQ